MVEARSQGKNQPRGEGAGVPKGTEKSRPTVKFDSSFIAKWKSKARNNRKYDREYQLLEQQGYFETIVSTIGRVNAFRKRFLAREGYKVLSQQITKKMIEEGAAPQGTEGQYAVLVIDLKHPGGKALWEALTASQ